MKNNNIKDTFELFSPTEERKEKIDKSIANRQKNKEKRIGFNFSAEFAYFLAACLVLIAMAAILLKNPIDNSSSPIIKPDNTQHYKAKEPSKNSSLPAAVNNKAVFQGFILTAYSANSKTTYLNANFMDEAEKQVLMPDIKVLLAKYSLAMSNVAGFPFTVDLSNSDKNNHEIQAINVSSDCGVLNRWDRNSGIVSSLGQTTTIGIGETIYWSPLYKVDDANEVDDTNVDKITITIEAIVNDTVIGRQSIYITQDEPGYYSATIGKLELL